MKYIFSAYPSGLPGVALLLMRLSVALFLKSCLSSPEPSLCIEISALALGLAIVTGFTARACALLSIVMLAVNGPPDRSGEVLITHVLDALALGLAGPGAYSLDARIFGRVTINLHS